MNSENVKDYYATLELDFKATKKEVRDKYKKLALQFHPDKNKNPSTEEYFKEIKEAYETLYDDNKRKQYDILYQKALIYNAINSALARETKMDYGIETGLLLAGGAIAGAAMYYGLKLLFGGNNPNENNENDTANDRYTRKKNKTNN